jgi:catechol 2,3-dioxygenase-like lactoylglutathione lyase family enzyme
VIDHFNLPVADLELSGAFYRSLLAPLGYPLLMRDGDAIGFGVDAWRFGLIATKLPINPLHVAFAAMDREQVDEFFAAGLAAGGQARGAPGVRTHYDPNYYAAYVTDPDGHNVEAVCRQAAPHPGAIPR